MGKKKKKDTFQEFRSNEKSAYTTIKTTLKSVLHNHKEVQPVRQERPVCFQISSFTSSNNQKEEEKVRPS